MKVNLASANIGVDIMSKVHGYSVVLRESGKVFIEVVEKRDAETFIPLIKNGLHLEQSLLVTAGRRTVVCLQKGFVT